MILLNRVKNKTFISKFLSQIYMRVFLIFIVLAYLMFRMQASDQSVTEQQNKHDSKTCNEQCQSLVDRDCQVCFNSCSNPQDGLFTLKKCDQRYCADYSISIIHTGKTFTTIKTCVRYQTKALSQVDCLASCCFAPPVLTFTEDILRKCVEDNVNQKNEKNKVLVIVISTLFGFLGLILMVFLACYLLRKSSCFKRTGQIQPEQSLRTDNTNKRDQNIIPVENKHKLRELDPISNSQQSQWKSLELEEDEQSQQNQTCSICLQSKTNCKTLCNHRFHLKCLSQWIKRNKKCPLCINKRYDPVKIYCQQCHKKYISLPISVNTQKRNFSLSPQTIQCYQCRTNQLKNKLLKCRFSIWNDFDRFKWS